MKRLPKNFIIMSRDYIQHHKYSLKLGGLTTMAGYARIWFVNETIAIYCSPKTARKAGRALAKSHKCGFVENVKRGERFTEKHRAYMILYDR